MVLEKESTIEFAWVNHQGRTYFTRSRHSPSVKLIQGIFEQSIDHSFFILRNRIFTTETDNAISRGMVKIAAKRILFAQPHPDWESLPDWIEILPQHQDLFFVQSAHLQQPTLPPMEGQISKTSKEIGEWIHRTLEIVPQGEVRHDFNRKILAVALDPDRQIRALEFNQNYKNKTLHAELLLAARLLMSSVPADEIICSLKPCRMCAAILKSLYDQGMVKRISYLEEDPGPLAQNTELDGKDYFSRIGN